MPFPSPPDPETQSKHGTVLVVEDEPGVRAFLAKLLGKKYHVLEASDTKEASAIMEETPLIHVIVCDYEMPGENGLQFLSRMRIDYPMSQRILLTGHTEKKVFLGAINEGDVLKFLPKGFSSPDELFSAVQLGFEKFYEMEDNEKVRKEHHELQSEVDSGRHRSQKLRSLTEDSWKFLGASMQVMFMGAVMMFLLGALVIIGLYVLQDTAGFEVLDKFGL